MTRPECEECGNFLEHPQNVQHVLTEPESMNFAMECKECGTPHSVWLSVASVSA